MQQTLEGIPTSGPPSRLRLPNIWELARRISGLAAIAILGITMLTLALRAETAPTAVTELPAAPRSEPAPPADAAATLPAAGPPPASILTPAYIPPEPTLVFYLYDTPDQRGMINLAESIAGQEAATDTVVTQPTYRGFVALDASTPELEQAARDTIFEALLANASRARVVIHDLRGR